MGGENGEREILRSCYTESLKLAEQFPCTSIAFPLISSSSCRFPRVLALTIAPSAIYDYLMKHDMMVYLVVLDETSFSLSGKIFPDVKAYIDEQYAAETAEKEYSGISRRIRREEDTLSFHLQKTESSFRDYLLQLIRERNMKNSDVYHAANITRQHFSKILSGSSYHPSKNTICALAIALKLDIHTADRLMEKGGLRQQQV